MLPLRSGSAQCANGTQSKVNSQSCSKTASQWRNEMRQGTKFCTVSRWSACDALQSVSIEGILPREIRCEIAGQDNKTHLGNAVKATYLACTIWGKPRRCYWQKKVAWPLQIRGFLRMARFPERVGRLPTCLGRAATFVPIY